MLLRQFRMKSWNCRLGALSVGVVCSLLWGCSANQPEPGAAGRAGGVGQGEATTEPSAAIAADAIVADASSVQVSGDPGAYSFSVEVSSPDEGCEQYADWWEVVAEDGQLVYRRILDHSHVDEQPFVRSGGPVEIGADTVVWVRAHMHPGGYGGQALRGTARGGFEAVEMEAGFAAGLENEPPQPEGCAF